MSLSRIGKMPIAIPAGVEVTISDNVFTAKGKLGQLSQDFHGDVNVKIEDGFVIVEPANIEKASAKHGLYRALFFNMVKAYQKALKQYKNLLVLVIKQKLKVNN